MIDLLVKLWPVISGVVLGGAAVGRWYWKGRSTKHTERVSAAKRIEDLADQALAQARAETKAETDARIDLLTRQAERAEVHAAEVAKTATDAAIAQQREIDRLNKAVDKAHAEAVEAWRQNRKTRGD